MNSIDLKEISDKLKSIFIILILLTIALVCSLPMYCINNMKYTYFMEDGRIIHTYGLINIKYDMLQYYDKEGNRMSVRFKTYKRKEGIHNGN